jgi:integrase
VATITKYEGVKGIRWQVKIRRQGRAESASFPSKKLAEDWARKLENDIVQNAYFPEQKQRVSRTCHELLELYNEREMPRKDKSTQRRQKQILRWWDSVLGDVFIQNVTTVLIEEYKHVLIKKHTVNTVNLYLDVLSPVFSWAASPRLGWLQANPFKDVKRLKEKPRLPVVSDEQLHILMDYCITSQSKHLRLFCRVALGTGGRHREILNLLWSHIDLRKNTVMFLDTKNDENRVVPIDSRTADILKEEYIRVATEETWHGPLGTRPVFLNKHTQKPITTMFNSWNTARKKAGLPWLHVHDLRHLYASRMAEKGGADLASLAELLGHKTLKVTLRYRHLTPHHNASLVEKMAEQTF